MSTPPTDIDLIRSIVLTSSNRREVFLRVANLRPGDMTWALRAFAFLQRVGK